MNFSYWTNSQDSNGFNIEYRIKWNGTGFIITGVRNSQNWTWDDEASAVGTYLSLANMQHPDIYVWSQALNGSVRIDINGKSIDPSATAKCVEPNYTSTFTFNCTGAASSTTPVIIYKEEVVQPGSTKATAINGDDLVCYDNCPDPDSNDPFYPYFDTWVWDDATGGRQVSKTYQFDATQMRLEYSGTPIVAPVASSDDFNMNIWTGALIPPQATLDANPNMLDCPWDNTQTCGWMAESAAPEFYRWETGNDSWNMLVALTNNQTNRIEVFQQPLSVDYEHTYTDGSTKKNSFWNIKVSVTFGGVYLRLVKTVIQVMLSTVHGKQARTLTVGTCDQ